MRVLLVSPAPTAGGVGQYADRLADELEDSVADREFLDRNAGPLRFLRQALAVGSTDTDVVHLQHVYGLFGSKSRYMWLFFPIVGGLLTLRGRPLVVTVHEVWTRETVSPPLVGVKVAYIRVVNWTMGRLADRILFLSPSSAATLSPTPSTSEIVPHGVDTVAGEVDTDDAKERFGFQPDDVVVAEFGYVNPRKGQDVFVDLARRADGWKFLLAGGPRKTHMESFYEGLLADAPENLTATGVLDEEEFHVAFAAADVAVLPYMQITQSGIFNWCAAYGLPTVASDIPYFERLAREFDCVETFPTGDVPAAHDALVRVVKDDERRSALASNIDQYARANSFESVAVKHREVYWAVCHD